MTATGTLTKKTEFQLNQFRRRPPKSGPRPTPIAAIAAQMPIAFARSSRGKTFVMMERVAGMISAPPMPMTARRAISWPEVLTATTAMLAPANTTSPVRSALLRPKRSPRVPAVSRKPAKARR